MSEKKSSENLMDMTDMQRAFEQAESWVSEYWPLETSVATNPLFGKIDQPFFEILKQLEKLGVVGTMPLSFYWNQYLSSEITLGDIQQAVIKTSPGVEDPVLLERSAEFLISENISAYYLKHSKKEILGHIFYTPGSELKEQEAIIQKVTEYLGLYFTESLNKNKNKKLNLLDFWIQETQPKFLNANSNLIQIYLEHLKIKAENYQDYFTHILFLLRGYASLIKWLENHPDNPWLSASAELEHLVLMWAYYHLEFKNSQSSEFFKPQNRLEPSVQYLWEQWYKDKYPGDIFMQSIFTSFASWADICFIWQTAYELDYQKKLIQKIKHNLVHTRIDSESSENSESSKIQAQFVFCMDTRSEGARRYLEINSGGAYQTFSSAGFFGIPFKLKKRIYEDSSESISWQSPGLIIPEIQVQEVPVDSSKKIFLSKLISACRQNFKLGEQGFISAFSFIEWASFFSVIKLFFKEINPLGFFKIKNFFKLNKKINLISEGDLNNLASNLAVFLKTLGLTQEFSDLVFIMGHEASADNNPFLSGLQCGACGGNSGLANAKLVCKLLNDFKIRNKLREKNVDILDRTVFIPGYHQTTIDEFFLDLSDSKIKQKNNNQIQKIQEDLKQVGKALAQERLKDWPNTTSTLKKQADWAELIPELGLANHTALIIGPRFLTQGLDLSRRCFLYSYDPEKDDLESSLLESIMAGPLVVAHWINAYYYFSTCAPKYFGGGNKAIHNLLGTIGVLEGNGGDIKIGLPEQSIYFKHQLLHEPRRLSVIVYGDRKKIDQIVNKNQGLKNLIQGQWLHLCVLDQAVG